jgi:mono/diheme cytochrome c family protein
VSTILFGIAGTCIAAAAGSDAALITQGHTLAAQKCGRCHAIGTTGTSSDSRSPPFRTLAQRYPLANLEEALSEGIMVGHQGPEMPQFQFSPEQIDALLAYLASIQTK